MNDANSIFSFICQKDYLMALDMEKRQLAWHVMLFHCWRLMEVNSNIVSTSHVIIFFMNNLIENIDGIDSFTDSYGRDIHLIFYRGKIVRRIYFFTRMEKISALMRPKSQGMENSLRPLQQIKVSEGR